MFLRRYAIKVVISFILSTPIQKIRSRLKIEFSIWSKSYAEVNRYRIDRKVLIEKWWHFRVNLTP